MVTRTIPRMASTSALPRLVGVNHVALEVADVDAAIAFYGAIFAVTTVEREGDLAFLAMGDQFLTLIPGDRAPDAERHFGLVVDDREAARAALTGARRADPARRTGSTSAIRGATASRSSTTATSASPRHRPCSAGWASRAWKKRAAPVPSEP